MALVAPGWRGAHLPSYDSAMQPVSDPDRLLETLGSSPMAMVISNPRRPDNPLEAVNPAFCALTGYSEEEATGRNCRFLAGSNRVDLATGDLRAAIAHERPALVEIINYRRDGSAFRNGVMIAPVFDSEGHLKWFLGSQVDLGDAAGSVALRRSDSGALVAGLPKRQRQVLGAMTRGLLNKQIAWELGISPKTVKMHRALLIERLGAATSAEAIRIGIEAGL